MEILLGAVVLILLAHLLITPVALIFWNRSLKLEIEQQDLRITHQRARISGLERKVAAFGEQAAPEADAPPQPPVDQETEVGEGAPDADIPDLDKPEEPPSEPVAEDATPIPVIKRDESKDEAPPAKTESLEERLEKTLASSWMIWLGAVTIGLGVVFLFTYAIEQGWMGPATRVVLGGLFGAALIAAGEWARRHSFVVVERVIGPDYVPPALVASGVFALYVSTFAAHALYGLIGVVVSFIALAAISFAGLLLALRHGAFVAIMALGGGYLVPALISAGPPAAAPVFLYLFVLTAACLALMMYRKWWFLAYATLIGALGWPLVWLFGPWVLADQGVLGAYVVGVGALFALFSTNLPIKAPQTPALAWLARMLTNTSGLGFVLSGALVVLLAIAADYNEAAFVFLGLFAVMGLAFGFRRKAYESLAVAAILVVAVGVFLWPQPVTVSIPEELQRLGVDSYATAFGPFIMPPEFLIFARSLVVFAVGAGLGCLAALRSADTPPVWSAIAAGAPIYFFVIGYWRIGGFEVDVSWASISLGIAAFNLAAAAYARRVLSGRTSDICVGFFATGCTTALALTFTCLLREAWLTVAISVEVLALAWIWSELRVREIRAVIYAAISVVAIRLILNHNILDYTGEGFWAFNWVLYGYGVPALAFYLASRFLGDPIRDPLSALCQIGAIAFAFLMVALQLRIWTTGAISGAHYDLLDQSVQTVWWIIAAGLLLRRELDEKLPQVWFGGVFLLLLAGVQIVFGHILWNNPLWSHEPVGSWPLLNLLGVAYLLPAILLCVIGRVDGFMLSRRVREPLLIAAGVLVFIYVTLEVRRAFLGGDLGLSLRLGVSDAEAYAYSAVWLVCALVLLGIGILQKSSFWRYASLAVLIVTVLKVFLYDMSDLTGLFRVASFLGLGLTLIGIGFVYQRLVFRLGEAAGER